MNTTNALNTMNSMKNPEKAGVPLVAELRAHLVLLAFSVILCCGIYPLVLLATGRSLFPSTASGGIIKSPDGTPIGARLIAQPFTGDEYFWPRPSAATYNGTASGGSNYGSSNPKLRDRVTQQLIPILVYKPGSKFEGRTPQQDLEEWCAGDADKLKADNRLDLWLADPVNHERVAALVPVPVDMVTTSGSGLDPDISLRNALSVYQLDRVARKRSTSKTFESVKQSLTALIQAQSYTPLSGLIGEPLVNVLELNLLLDKQFPIHGAN